ncbi:MAG: HAMP domain-containing histidine kinase [Spirulinaceae cyanobacterium RM2_2_10]|nr:HAMP domain-containing histidine kinase [Spirulinaceae cyanobacterium RM2_2_10]
MDEIETLKAELQRTKLAYQAALQMSQFKAGFLARTSHELRSPLNSLIGLHQLILADLCEDPAEEREFIDQAHQSALKLLQLIDEIIDIAKTDFGTNTVELRPTAMSSVFVEVERLTHLQAANRGHWLEAIAPTPELYVIADFQRLSQALAALIDASIAYMEEGSLRLTAQAVADQPLVQIWLDLCSPTAVWSEPADLLAQVPPPSPELAREQFRTRQAPSRGISLLFSQKLIERLGGNLEIRAAAGSRC